MTRKIKTKHLVLASIVVIVALFALNGKNIISMFSKNYGEKMVGTEITQIKDTTDMKVQSELYLKLIERVGPEEAQLDLLKSGLPFTGQTHLLNHVVGDYLYEKYGTGGLHFCKDYFLSSCYHGFVLHAIADGGIPEVAKTFSECLKWGPTVYVQCSHGIGHGFLAYAGYKNVVEALKTCDVAEKTMPQFPVYNCYDGIFMENIWAVHDGVPSPDRWVKANDVNYPCNDPRIEEKYKNACWSNQPSLAYQLLKGDIKKVGQVCLAVQNKTYQVTCFDGLARQIHPITNGSAAKAFSLCGLMPTDKWKNSCLYSNVVAGFSVGDRSTPFQICAAMPENDKRDCYNRLFGVMHAYVPNPKDFKNMCSLITESAWNNLCISASGI